MFVGDPDVELVRDTSGNSGRTGKTLARGDFSDPSELDELVRGFWMAAPGWRGCGMKMTDTAESSESRLVSLCRLLSLDDSEPSSW